MLYKKILQTKSLTDLVRLKNTLGLCLKKLTLNVLLKENW